MKLLWQVSIIILLINLCYGMEILPGAPDETIFKVGEHSEIQQSELSGFFKVVIMVKQGFRGPDGTIYENDGVIVHEHNVSTVSSIIETEKAVVVVMSKMRSLTKVIIPKAIISRDEIYTILKMGSCGK